MKTLIDDIKYAIREFKKLWLFVQIMILFEVILWGLCIASAAWFLGKAVTNY